MDSGERRTVSNMIMTTAADWSRLQSTGGLMDLSRYVKLRVTGPDALRYLNGQVTNDLRRLAAGGSMPACFCTHKGKLEAFVQVSLDAAGTYYLTAEESLRDFLPPRVGKYLIADDAALEDVTDAFSFVHGFGEARTLPAPAASGPGTLTANRMGTAGVDVWLPAGAASAVPFTEPAAIEILRIDRGLPAWENELSQDILPPEAGLDATAIDYHKGCYTGQEVISRLRSVGKVNKLLKRLVVADGHHVEAGWQLYFQTGDGALTPAGVITSAAWHPALQTGIALGYVKRSAGDGPFLAAAPNETPVIRVDIRKPLDDQQP